MKATDKQTTWNHSPTAGHDRHGQSAVYDETGKDIAIVYDGKAHGDLIAAAPEMLAACELAEEIVTTRHPEMVKAIDMLQCAIAKARGQ